MHCLFNSTTCNPKNDNHREADPWLSHPQNANPTGGGKDYCIEKLNRACYWHEAMAVRATEEVVH
jgi:hypothetical protein